MNLAVNIGVVEGLLNLPNLYHEGLHHEQARKSSYTSAIYMGKSQCLTDEHRGTESYRMSRHFSVASSQAPGRVGLAEPHRLLFAPWTRLVVGV